MEILVSLVINYKISYFISCVIKARLNGNGTVYSKTPLLRPPLGLRKNGLYSGVVLLLSLDKEEINEMGL